MIRLFERGGFIVDLSDEDGEEPEQNLFVTGCLEALCMVETGTEGSHFMNSHTLLVFMQCCCIYQDYRTHPTKTRLKEHDYKESRYDINENKLGFALSVLSTTISIPFFFPRLEFYCA